MELRHDSDAPLFQSRLAEEPLAMPFVLVLSRPLLGEAASLVQPNLNRAIADLSRRY